MGSMEPVHSWITQEQGALAGKASQRQHTALPSLQRTWSRWLGVLGWECSLLASFSRWSLHHLDPSQSPAMIHMGNTKSSVHGKATELGIRSAICISNIYPRAPEAILRSSKLLQLESQDSPSCIIIQPIQTIYGQLRTILIIHSFLYCCI